MSYLTVQLIIIYCWIFIKINYLHIMHYFMELNAISCFCVILQELCGCRKIRGYGWAFRKGFIIIKVIIIVRIRFISIILGSTSILFLALLTVETHALSCSIPTSRLFLFLVSCLSAQGLCSSYLDHKNYLIHTRYHS